VRILICKEEDKALLDFLKSAFPDGQIDFFDDYEDVEYCTQTRKYDYVFIKDKDSAFNQILNSAKTLQEKNTPLIILNSNNKKHINIYKKYNANITKEEDLSFFKDFIEKNENLYLLENKFYKIDTTNKKIYIKEDSKLKELSLEKEIDYKVFVYFARHYGEVLSVFDLLCGTQEDPEFIRNSIIEVSIATIRKALKNLKSLTIVSHKKQGYQFTAVK